MLVVRGEDARPKGGAAKNDPTPSPAYLPTQPMDDPAAGDWEPRAGDLLGDRYELLEELGRGGSGVVFRARDRIADTVVAIKVLPRSQVPDAVARLRRELHAARKISHPGVVRIHDLIELGGRMALSME